MSKLLFVFITQEPFLTKVAGVDDFDPALGFDFENPFCLLYPKQVKKTLSDTDVPQVVLVHDQIDASTFCENLSRIAPCYDRLYIAWHEHGVKLQKKHFMKCPFGYKTLPEEGIHIKRNRIYSLAINFINNDPDAKKKAIRGFEGNTPLNLLIDLQKKLGSIPIKLDNSWKKKNFDEEIKRLKESANSDLIKKRLEQIHFTKNLDDFYTQIEVIEGEIIQLTADK